MIRRIQRGRNHSYTINGNKALGVTTALNKGLPKPNLITWAARCVAEEVADMDAFDLNALRSMGRDSMVAALKAVPNQRRDNAAVRGTKIHGYAEQVIAGEDVQVPDELVAHVQNVVKFLDEWKVRPLISECTIGSYAWGYAGTLDLVGELSDGRRVLFDYKTGASGIWPETALQLAAYRHADAYVAPDGTEVPLKILGISEAKAVWIRADGFDVVPVATDEAVHKVFLHILAVARAADRMSEWVGAPELVAA